MHEIERLVLFLLYVVARSKKGEKTFLQILKYLYICIFHRSQERGGFHQQQVWAHRKNAARPRQKVRAQHSPSARGD